MKTKILKIITLLAVLFTPLLSGVSGFSAVNYIENEEDLIGNLSLNPQIRIDLLRKELYPELYPVISNSFVNDNYYLPITGPVSTYVTQTYFGSFSHQSTRAIDFFGTNLSVSASRKGVVLSVNVGGKWNGWCNSYQDCYDKGGIWNGNHVVVSHSDGTYAFYTHLKENSLREGIEVGAAVRRGEVIADVGETGYTCGNLNCTIPGAHLHFQVNVSSGVTISTPFEDCKIATNTCDSDDIPFANYTYNSINYPPSLQNYDGRQNALYLFGTDLVVSAESLNSGSELIISSLLNQNSLWTLDVESSRLMGDNNLCLADTGSNTLKLQTCNTFDNQKWSRYQNYQLRNNSTGKCIESQDGNSIGSKLILSTCGNNPSQYFRLSQEFIPIRPITP